MSTSHYKNKRNAKRQCASSIRFMWIQIIDLITIDI